MPFVVHVFGAIVVALRGGRLVLTHFGRGREVVVLRLLGVVLPGRRGLSAGLFIVGRRDRPSAHGLVDAIRDLGGGARFFALSGARAGPTPPGRDRLRRGCADRLGHDGLSHGVTRGRPRQSRPSRYRVTLALTRNTSVLTNLPPDLVQDPSAAPPAFTLTKVGFTIASVEGVADMCFLTGKKGTMGVVVLFESLI